MFTLMSKMQAVVLYTVALGPKSKGIQHPYLRSTTVLLCIYSTLSLESICE